MAIQQSANHSTIRTMYLKNYIDGAKEERLYDNFAGVVKDTIEPQGSSVTVVASTDMVPRPTTAVGSETSDFDPQTIGEVTGTVTIGYYNDGLKAHELAALESTFALKKEYAKKVGKNMMETIDALARRAATEGGVVFYGTHTTRATLDQGTVADLLTYAKFSKYAAFAKEWRIKEFAGGTLMAVISPWAYQDLINEASSALLLRQAYTESGKEQLFNNEVGMLAGIRLVVNSNAKMAYAAGAANASAVATTLSSATAAGAKTLSVAANTNIAVGQWLIVGTAQTGTESDTTLITEPCFVTGVSGTTITVAGRHELGGLRYAHASGIAVSNADSVALTVVGGAESLAKVYHKSLGEFGKPVFDKVDGMADQWTSWAWKWLGGYGRLAESRLVRIESSCSMI